jgi:hypothetical protein
LGVTVYVADDFAGVSLHKDGVGAVDAGDVQFFDGGFYKLVYPDSDLGTEAEVLG